MVGPSAVLCIEALGEGSKKAEDFTGLLLFGLVSMAFVAPVVIWFLVGRVEVENGVVFIWGWWPFAVRLPTRHGVSAELTVSPGRS